MAWTVLERRVVPVNSTRGAEDGILWTHARNNRIVGIVADGHSSGVLEPIDGISPGQFVVRTFFEAVRTTSLHGDLRKWVSLLNDRVGEALASTGRFTETIAHPDYRRPGLVFVAFVPNRNVIVRVGDCQYFVDREGDNPGLRVDREKAERRRSCLQALLSEGAQVRDLLANDPTQVEMMHLLRNWQHKYRNSSVAPYGYGVVDGSPIPPQHIEIISVPPKARRVVLTSDGIPPRLIRPTFEETWGEFLGALNEDPLCIGDMLAGVRGGVPDQMGVPGPYDDFSYFSFENMDPGMPS